VSPAAGTSRDTPGPVTADLAVRSMRPRDPARPAPPSHPGGRRLAGRRPLLSAVGLLAGAVLLLPPVFLLVEAHGAGAGSIAALIARPLTGQLLWNTVRLAVAVTVACSVIGTGAAWLTERTQLPGRRVWVVLIVVPLAIPDFVVSFGWASLSTAIAGFRGAVLVMSLALYPLVYLPVAASFRNADPGQEEVARSLGAGRLRTFWRITIGQARVAILGGCLLVVLVLLAEYGAFEILGYQTFTTEIFTESSSLFDLPSACALSLVLIALGLLVLGGESALRGRGRVSRTGPQVQRATTRHRLGRWAGPAQAALGALAALALGVPVASACYWWVTGTSHPFTGMSLLGAGGYTFLYSGCAALLSTVLALPVAILALRRYSLFHRLLERGTYLVLAIPGLVVALSLAYFSETYAGGFEYQQAPLLILAYAIMFFPLALTGVRASVAQAPAELEDIARSLGQRRLAVLWRVTRPLVTPGLAASFCLVFLSAVTELTATLILVPTGVQTLATQFWNYQQNLAYGQAAPFALAIIVLAAGPSYVLGRYFDRLPARAAAGAETALAPAALPS
jgi:iron(III) transport system permease protein